MSREHLGKRGDAAPADSNAPSAGEAARPIPEAAQRALAEAEERRRRAAAAPAAPELNGRGGLDPARYGDWEVKGIAADL